MAKWECDFELIVEEGEPGGSSMTAENCFLKEEKRGAEAGEKEFDDLKEEWDSDDFNRAVPAIATVTSFCVSAMSCPSK